jgi:hypothetical protein
MEQRQESKPGYHWDDDWRHVKLMEWLTCPPPDREPRSKAKLAEELGVEPRTLRGWSEGKAFREEWQSRVTRIVGNPDRAQYIMDTLYRTATDPKSPKQVAAAKLYLEATNAIRPPALEVTVKRPEQLSDAELDALLAQGASELRTERDALSSTQPSAGREDDESDVGGAD